MCNCWMATPFKDGARQQPRNMQTRHAVGKLKVTISEVNRLVWRPFTLILAAAALLLLPAFLIGERPFIYWDTPTFYSWGHDILQAIKSPWPSLAEFPSHRGLWAADMTRGAWDRITSEQFQLVMTSIGARSSFYAVPFYALGSAFTLWAPAVVQALIAAWLLWVTVAVVLPGAQPVVYLRLVAVLTVASAAPFFAAFLMPDVFAAFALLTTTLLLCFRDRLTGTQRVGCAVLLTASVLVHLSVLPTVAVLLLAGFVTVPVVSPTVPAWRGASVAAVALVCAGVAAAASGGGLKAIFGQEVRSPPFMQARVIADGPGQQFLREVCAQQPFAACIWKDLNVVFTDDIIWPDHSWNNLPLITDPAERRRYLDEQPAVVLGTLSHHPLDQIHASMGNAVRQLLKFTISNDVGGALHGVMNQQSDRPMRLAEIAPNIEVCLTDSAQACDYTSLLRLVQPIHYAAVLGAVLVLGVYVVRWTRSRGAGEDMANNRRLAAFALVVVGGVTLNAIPFI